jgi:hypothetical protein
VTAAPTHRVAPAGRDRRALAGVVLAGRLCFGLSAYSAARLPPFCGGDERAHFSYTVSLLDGRLPEVTDVQPFADRYPIIERSLDPPGPAPPGRERSSPPTTRR